MRISVSKAVFYNLRVLILQVDTYGTQQPIALLKLLVERGFMYDRGKDLNLKNFRDISYLAAMGKVKAYINLQLFSSFFIQSLYEQSVNSLYIRHFIPVFTFVKVCHQNAVSATVFILKKLTLISAS